MNKHGVTLVELLIALVISSIAFFGLALPFIAERVFWAGGTQQTEAQRDAQIGMRAIARAVRQSKSCVITAPGDVTFTITATCIHRFRGGPTFGNQLRHTETCSGGSTTTLIDGGRSRVTQFTVTKVGTKLVRVRLVVTNQARGIEDMETEFYLRNAT